MRGLTLSCHITLGNPASSSVLTEWKSATGIVIRAAYVTWQHGPGMQELLGRCRPLRFIPSFVTVSPQDSFVDILRCFAECDQKQQQLRQDREAEQGGGDESRSWLRAAGAAAEATHVLLGYASRSEVPLPDEKREGEHV
jgi:hypothetical protein